MIYDMKKMFREEWGEIIIETVQKFMKPDAIKLNIYKYKGQKYLWSLSQDVLQMSVLASVSQWVSQWQGHQSPVLGQSWDLQICRAVKMCQPVCANFFLPSASFFGKALKNHVIMSIVSIVWLTSL